MGKEQIEAQLNTARRRLKTSQQFLDHAEEEGWIEQKYPGHLRHLSLLGGRLAKFHALLDEGGIADTRARIRDVAIPRRIDSITMLQVKLAGLTSSDDEGGNNNTGSTGEELLGREQIFTDKQAVVIANVVIQKLGAAFLAPNKDALFTFEVDEADKEQTMPVIDQLSKLPVDPEAGNLSSNQRVEFRKRSLQELNLLLSDRELLDQAFDQNKVSPNMQTFLMWLFEQNDKYGGKLCDLLALPVDYKTAQYTNPTDNTHDYKRIQATGKFVYLPPELSPFIKEQLKRYAQRPAKIVIEPSKEESSIVLQPEEGLIIYTLLDNRLAQSEALGIREALEILKDQALPKSIDTTWTKNQYVQLRTRALSKLKGILLADPKEAINKQTDDIIHLFLGYLLENDENFQSRMDFLTWTLHELTAMTKSRIRAAESSLYEGIIKLAKTAKKSTETEDEKDNEKLVEEPQMFSDNKDLKEKQDRKSKEAAEKRNILKEELKGYMRKVLKDPELPVMANPRQITRAFNSLTDEVIKLFERKEVPPTEWRDSYTPLFDSESVTLLLLVLDRRRKGGIRDKELKAAKDMVTMVKQDVIQEFKAMVNSGPK